MSRQSVLDPAEMDLKHWSRGTLYEGNDVRLGPLFGLKALGLAYSEVPPGKSGCPFHNHHAEDEAFVILKGEGIYRHGDQRIPVRAGHVLGAPMGGRDTAHQLLNTGTVPLRYLSISSKAGTDICEYPDSNKVLAQTSDPVTGAFLFSHMTIDDGGVDYWTDEPGA